MCIRDRVSTGNWSIQYECSATCPQGATCCQTDNCLPFTELSISVTSCYQGTNSTGFVSTLCGGGNFYAYCIAISQTILGETTLVKMCSTICPETTSTSVVINCCQTNNCDPLASSNSTAPLVVDSCYADVPLQGFRALLPSTCISPANKYCIVRFFFVCFLFLFFYFKLLPI